MKRQEHLRLAVRQIPKAALRLVESIKIKNSLQMVTLCQTQTFTETSGSHKVVLQAFTESTLSLHRTIELQSDSC